MKNIVGKEAKIYNYINNVFMTVSGYYGYENIKLPTMVEDKAKAIKDFYNESDLRGLQKYCYLGSICDNDKEINQFGFININIDSLYQDAEMISMVYRILEELRLENLIVKIKSDKKYDVAKLQEYLEYLDVDYELDDGDNLLDDNKPMAFEVVEIIQDKKIVLASGFKSKDNVNTNYSVCYIDNILEVLSVIYEAQDFSAITQVTIVAESEEERIAGMRLAQDLRWCEIIVDFDTAKKTRKEQLDNIKNSNFIIDINKDDLSKGLIKVIDGLTHEETLIDESEIIDYIVSNI